jgi:hypothetical protein
MNRRLRLAAAAGCALTLAGFVACNSSKPSPAADNLDAGDEQQGVGEGGDDSPGSDGTSEEGSQAVGDAGTVDGTTNHPSDGAPEPDAHLDGSTDSSVAADVYHPPSDAAQLTSSCNPTATWGTPVAVPGVPSFASQPFMTMTASGLTVAWVTSNGGGMGSVFVADRATDSDTFGAATQLAALPDPEGEAGAGFFAFDRVALSGDGLTLIAVDLAGTEMVQFYRIQAGAAFTGMALPGRYTALSVALNKGETLADPVLSDDGQDLIYSRYGLSNTVSMYESTSMGGGNWATGVPLSSASLSVTTGSGTIGSRRRLPMGLSGDRLDLFVWNPSTSKTEEVPRVNPTGDFGSFATSIGSWYSVQANLSCTRLYFIAPSGGGYALEQVDEVGQDN